jgi:transcriptional regulator with XRE-family HTH domain
MMSFAAGVPPRRADKSEPETVAPEHPLREFIHEQMRLRGWKRYAEFAKAIGADGSLVSRWLRDRRPSPEMTRQMAKALGVDEQHLMAMVGHISPVRTDVTPEQAAIIEKVRQVPMTRDRFLVLDAILEVWRRPDPPSSEPSNLK